MAARRPVLSAALALLAATASARAAPPVDGLLDGLLGPREPQGRVVVAAHVEPAAGHRVLVVELRPLGDAKLVADPGAVLRGTAVDGVTWLAPEAKALEPGRSYFDGAVRLALPFRAEGAEEVRARVDYAWCLVGFQCLFGGEDVRVPLPAAPSG